MMDLGELSAFNQMPGYMIHRPEIGRPPQGRRSFVDRFERA
jgi:hypothetical protein